MILTAWRAPGPPPPRSLSSPSRLYKPVLAVECPGARPNELSQQLRVFRIEMLREHIMALRVHPIPYSYFLPLVLTTPSLSPTSPGPSHPRRDSRNSNGRVTTTALVSCQGRPHAGKPGLPSKTLRVSCSLDAKGGKKKGLIAGRR